MKLNSCFKSFSRFISHTTSRCLLPFVPFNHFDQLVRKEQEIKTLFSEKGYLILSPPSDDQNLLLDITRLFGKVQRHERSPENGIVEIRSKKVDVHDQQVVSDMHFFAHTDGAYLEGMTQYDGGTFRVAPPKIVVLQCIKPAQEGGASFLVDGKAILLSVLKNHHHLINTLFSLNCFSICRENHLVMSLPVFKKLPSGNFSIRFSYDQDLYASKDSMEKLSFFNENYILNPAFITQFSLSNREILVLDNHRYLHGRTAVKGDRLLKRIWIYDEALSTEMRNPSTNGGLYYGSIQHATRALTHYNPYTPIKAEEEKFFYKDLSVGIYLPETARTKIDRLLKMP